MFPSFVFLGKTIGVYGLMAVIGYFVAFFCCYFTCKKNINFDNLILSFVACGIGILIGGHLLYFFTNIPAFVNTFPSFKLLSFYNKIKFIAILFSGNVFYGGFLGGIIALAVFSKISSKNVREHLDLYAIATPVFHFFGRIGCFFAGCCYGKESSFGFTIHNNIYNPSVNDVCRFPVQLLESFLNLIIFIIILFFYKKGKFTHKLLLIYMILYPIVRFLDEFIRDDEYRGIWFGLSTSQWISIALVVVSIIHFIVINQKTKSSNKIIDE